MNARFLMVGAPIPVPIQMVATTVDVILDMSSNPTTMTALYVSNTQK